MDANQRKKFTQTLRRRYRSYVTVEALGQLRVSVEKRLNRLASMLRDLQRKEVASENSVKALPQLASTLFGVEEDIKRIGASKLEFSIEKEIINSTLLNQLR
ncbi:MAG: hypothetical protein JJU29_05940 [Verrucomicrobia bacterium]|nr:hypothetical protein [Verrucomicrobiota bacterium]